MNHKIDYKAVKKIIDILIAFNDTANASLSNCFAQDSQITYDYRIECVIDERVTTFIKNNNELIYLLEPENTLEIPVDLYLLLYSHYYLKPYCGALQSYKEVLKKVEASPLYANVKKLDSQLELLSLAYYCTVADVKWKRFIDEFDGTDWAEIHLFQHLLPFGNLTIEDLCQWIEKVAKEQENDGALFSVGESV